MSEIYADDDVDGLTLEDLHRLLTGAPGTCRDLRRTMRADDMPLDAKLGAAVDLLIRSVERIDKLEGVILTRHHRQKSRWSATALAGAFIRVEPRSMKHLLTALLQAHFENIAPDDVPALAVRSLLEALVDEAEAQEIVPAPLTAVEIPSPPPPPAAA